MNPFSYHKTYDTDDIKVKLHHNICHYVNMYLAVDKREQFELDLDEQVSQLSENGVLTLPMVPPSVVNQVIHQLNFCHYRVTSVQLVHEQLWLTYHFN